MYLIKRVQEFKLSTGIVDFRNSKDVCNVSRRVVRRRCQTGRLILMDRL